MSIISAEDFTFTYPGNDEPTLKKISFDIEPGETLGLIGPVGAGKTTLCMAIAGFVPSVTGGDVSGKMKVTGTPELNSGACGDRRSPANVDERNANDSSKGDNEEQIGQVGMVFEDFAAQLTHLQILDELITPLRERGISQQDAENQARELMQRVGLDPNLEQKRVWEISGGQQLRLAFAAVLALDPPIFILDNLLDKFDPWEQDRIISIVKEIEKEKTVVIVESNITLIHQLVDRFLVLVDGEVISEGPADEILRNRDLLSQADILPPLPLQVARDLGLEQTPLTSEEFEQMIANRNQSHHNSQKPNPSINQMVEIKDYREIENEPQGYYDDERQVQSDQRSPQARSFHDGVFGDSQPHEQQTKDFGQPVICVQEVSYYYGKKDNRTKALNNVSITVREGEVHGVIGRSGSGKTTLIKLIAGLMKPSEGQINIWDMNIGDNNVPYIAMTVGTALQNPDSQISEKTVREEIGFPLKHRQYEKTGLFSKRQRYDDDYIEERVSQVCELVGVDEKLFEEDPFLLPRGQRKLVTIAEALMVDPKALILDEPGVGLGETSSHKISELLTHLCGQDKAVLLTGNDVNFIANVADTVTILDRGRVILQGTVHEVFAPNNWDKLSQLNLQPPTTARLAQRVNLEAVNYQELLTKLSSK